MAGFGIGVNDIGVSHIHDVYIAGQVGCVIFVIIGTGVAEAEQGGGFANCARAEAGTAAVLCACVKGRTKDGHIRVKLVPVYFKGPFAKCCDPHKWEVKPAAVIAVFRHFYLLHSAQLWRKAGRKQVMVSSGLFNLVDP